MHYYGAIFKNSGIYVTKLPINHWNLSGTEGNREF